MPNRSYTAGSQFRYGFNGQEKSDEIVEGLTTALYWEYDSRIGRRWNVDPVLKVGESPYSCFSNNPILRTDPNGDTDSTNASSNGGKPEPPKNGLILKYGGTNFQPLVGNVRSFHNSENNFQNLNLGLGIVPTNLGLGSKTGTIDEPAAIAEIGWRFKLKNGGQWQVGLQWNHMKPDPIQGVYLDNGYTQVGPYIGKEQQLNTNSKILKTVSVNSSLSIGAMFSKPRVADGFQGNVQGYTKDCKYSIVGVGATFSIAPTLKITKWFSIFGSLNIHASTTKPLNIDNGNAPGPGKVSTVASSLAIGGKVSIHF